MQPTDNAETKTDPLDYARRHMRFGWWSLPVFLSLGIVLEAITARFWR